LHAPAAQEFIGKLLEPLEENLTPVFGDLEKPFIRPLEVDRVCLDAKFFP